MSYRQELRTNWRALLAALLGMSSGLSLNSYVGSIFAPHMIAEFGWARSQYALIGLGALTLVVVIPVYGRLADLFGVRKVALAGVIGYSASLLLMSLNPGSFWYFFWVFVFQNVVAGTTVAAIYSRIVAQAFDKARGFAIGIAVSGPAFVGLIVPQPMTAFIVSEGWRAGYQLFAAACLTSGITALLLMPHSIVHQSAREKPGGAARKDYGIILRAAPFWLLFCGLALAQLTHSLTSQQLGNVLTDSHIAAADLGWFISAYAIGGIAGRLVCGYALDRFPTHLVAFISHAIPAAGLVLLGSSLDNWYVVATAVLLIGVAIGAEGDIIGYIVVRIFGLHVYGSVFGLVSAGVGLSSALGATLLSLSLAANDNHYDQFLYITGGAMLLSSVLFFLLGRYMREEQPESEPTVESASVLDEAA